MNALVRRLALAALLAACRRDPAPSSDVPPCHRRHGDASPGAIAPLPGASLFLLEGAWSDQTGAPFSFAAGLPLRDPDVLRDLPGRGTSPAPT